MSELNRVDTTLLEVIAGMKDGKAEGAFRARQHRKRHHHHENR